MNSLFLSSTSFPSTLTYIEIALFIRLQPVRELGPLFAFPSTLTYIELALFIRLQPVRELGPLFEYPSSDHPIPPSPDSM